MVHPAAITASSLSFVTNFVMTVRRNALICVMKPHDVPYRLLVASADKYMTLNLISGVLFGGNSHRLLPRGRVKDLLARDRIFFHVVMYYFLRGLPLRSQISHRAAQNL